MLSYRKYRVVKKVRESDRVVSLYLESADGGQLEAFKPGQHLMFRLNIPGHGIPAVRYYSFSDQFTRDYYRISIKRESAPANHAGVPDGLCSYYLFDETREGDILEAKGPVGDFFLDPAATSPVVLIAGGIGITPLLSMLKSIAAAHPKRSVWFFYGVNERSDYAFEAELRKLRHDCRAFQLYTFCVNAGHANIAELGFDFEGFIDIDTILARTRGADVNYYICGPGAMMNYLTDGLENHGVAKNRIYTESFSSEVTNAVPEDSLADGPENGKEQSGDLVIEFVKSGRHVVWDSRYRSIVEFAEANDIEITSGCLFGDCGTCLTTVREGEIEYTHATAVTPEKGKCLPCSCIPASSLVLEA